MNTRRNILKGVGSACGCMMFGRPLTTLGNGNDTSHMPINIFCADGEKYNLTGIPETFDPAPEAIVVINRIVRSVGISTNFTVRAGLFTEGYSAVATKFGTELVIMYDREEHNFRNGHIPFTSLATLAHEVGHHVHSHFLTGGSTPPKEIEADKFSGFAMGHLGLTLDQSLIRARQYSEAGSDTHPSREERVRAVSDGWQDAVLFQKSQQVAQCIPKWLDSEMNVGGETCRIVHRCGKFGPRIRLACKAKSDQWIWAN